MRKLWARLGTVGVDCQINSNYYCIEVMSVTCLSVQRLFAILIYAVAEE